MPDGRTAEAVFFGRHRERDRLHRLAEDALNGRAGTLLIAGPAGIGKTSLVRQLIDEIGDDFETVVTMRCSEFDAAPNEPLARLAALTGAPLVVGDAASDAPPTDPVAARRAERHAARALATAVLDALTGPALVVVDDLQWAGRPVLDVIELLAVELGAEPERSVLLIVITRPLPPDHDTANRLDRLVREIVLTRLDLEPIDEVTTAELVRSRSPSATTAFVSYVHRSARGNPLLARATADFLERRGVPQALSAADPRAWTPHVPDSLSQDPVATWLAALPTELTRLCGQCAAIGGDFDVETAELVSATDGLTAPARREQVLGWLHEAVDLRLLDSDGRWFWFRHDVFREELYRSLRTGTRQRAHARLAMALLTGGATDAGDAIRLGRHLLACGGLLDAADGVADALAAAARAAVEARSWDEAGRFYEAHLARSGAEASSVAGRTDLDPSAAAAHLELLLEVGLAHFFNAEHRGASRRLSEAIDLADRLDDDGRRAKALARMLQVETAVSPSAVRRPPEVSALRTFLDEAVDPGPRAQVLQAEAAALVTAGLVERGEQDANQALQLASKVQDPTTAALAGQVLGCAALNRSSPVEALGRYERAHHIASDTDDWFAADTIAARMAYAHLATGSLERTHHWGELARAEAEANRDLANLSLADAALGMSAYLRGDYSMARRHLEIAASVGRRADYVPVQLFVTPSEVLTLLALDDRAGATRALAATDNPLSPVTRALWALVDRYGTAQLDDLPCELRDRYIGASGAVLVAASQEGRAVGRERIELLEEAVAAGGEVPTTLPLSNRRVLGVALAAAGEVEAALAHLDRAEQLWRREHGYTELVEVLLAAAEANEAVGRRELADRQAAEAGLLAERLGMAEAGRRSRRLRRLGSDGDPGQAAGVEGVIVMSDVVGSSAVSSRHGDQAYYDLVMQHHTIVRRRLDQHGGVEFSEGGDSLFAWFLSPEEALDCAIAIQLDAARVRRSGRELSIRVGVAGGQPFFSDGRPYGSVVNRAAGLTEQAMPHQVVVDETMLARMAPVIPDLTTRAVELKGFGPQTIGVLVPSDLAIADS